MRHSQRVLLEIPNIRTGIAMFACGALLCFGGCLSQASDEAGRNAPSGSVEPTTAERVARIQQQAQAGDAKAQWVLGMLYLNGEEFPLDLKESAKWMRKSADQNHPNAQFMLGLMYANEYGLPKDDRAAVEWFRRAKANGFDLDAVRKEYCEKYEQLRNAETNAWLEHIAKYRELHRGSSPESEAYQDVDGSFRFYEGSVSSRHERDTEALEKRLQASRPARQRQMDQYEKLVGLIDKAKEASPADKDAQAK